MQGELAELTEQGLQTAGLRIYGRESAPFRQARARWADQNRRMMGIRGGRGNGVSTWSTTIPRRNWRCTITTNYGRIRGKPAVPQPHGAVLPRHLPRPEIVSPAPRDDRRAPPELVKLIENLLFRRKLD